jgi:NAD+ kinase
MPSVGLIFHGKVNPQEPAIDAARGWLQRNGFGVWEQLRSPAPDSLRGRLEHSQLVVTFGGDGTLLWAAREAAPVGVPLLGVNLGRLGFLAEVELNTLVPALEGWAHGRFHLEARLLLEATVHRGGEARPVMLALNDVLVHRTQGVDTGHGVSLVRFEVAVDHEPAAMFDADGMLASTATGSTGYALSLGGPIMHPRVRGLILTPVNPHSLFNRAVVLPAESSIDITPRREPGVLTCDGQTQEKVEVGERVHVQAARQDVQFVRFGGWARFFELLRQKLRWGIPLVEE